MKVLANAKINIGLNVIKRREDGYHELEMLMLPIDLSDSLDISFDIQTTLITNKSYIPTDERNSIIKIINKLREKYKFNDQFSINLRKEIPTQAGLGGGTSDAAFVLKTLNSLLDLKMTQQEMIDFSKNIGADIPFFVVNKPAYVSGIGEKIETFKMNCPFYILLVKPKKGVSTKLAYEGLDFKTINHPNINLIKSCLINNDYETLVKSLGNSLEQTAIKIAPVILKIKRELIEYGFDCALMSGSGSTVFALTRNEELINKAEVYFKNKYYFVKKTKILND